MKTTIETDRDLLKAKIRKLSADKDMGSPELLRATLAHYTLVLKDLHGEAAQLLAAIDAAQERRSAIPDAVLERCSAVCEEFDSENAALSENTAMFSTAADIMRGATFVIDGSLVDTANVAKSLQVKPERAREILVAAGF